MVRIVGLSLTVFLVAFQFWFSAASAEQRDRLPPWLRGGMVAAADGLFETTDAVGDVLGPRWHHGWNQTKIAIGLMAAPPPERSGVVATGQDLTGEDFTARRLAEASFGRATLDGASFVKAYLVRASMDGASAVGADFSRAVLERASLRGADLRRSVMTGADLTRAMLDGADLSGADLAAAKGLVQAQLDAACGDEATRLPAGLTVPPCTPPAPLASLDAPATR